MNRWPLIASFVMFLALCVSVAYWGMQLFNPPLRAVAAPPQTNQAAPSLDAAAGLFGGHAHAVLASNFQLKGVVVASNPAESVAILVANGKSAQAVHTNKEVLPGVTVKEVNSRYVLLSEGGVIKRVELPENAKTKMKVGMSNHTPGNSMPANSTSFSHSSGYADQRPRLPVNTSQPSPSPSP